MSEEIKEEIKKDKVEPEVVKKKNTSVTPNPKKVAKEPETKEAGWKMVPRALGDYDLVSPDVDTVAIVADTVEAYKIIKNLERPVIKL